DVHTLSGNKTELKEFSPTSAEIWLYNVASKKNIKLSLGYFDTSPDWLDNETIVFASTRANTYVDLAVYGRGPVNSPPMIFGKAWHIYKAKIKDNTLIDFYDMTPHESFAMTPTVLSTGHICYS